VPGTQGDTVLRVFSNDAREKKGEMQICSFR
jgi:hypothetical protein